MIPYTPSTQLPRIERVHKTKKKGTFSDHILTFDMETTSLFYIDGEFRPFDYSRKPDFYRTSEKRALPYIWQFGYDREYYYSRDFYSFADLLESIADDNVTQFVHVHNLSFEFVWLVNIFKRKGWHIDDLLARGVRKVISFKIRELNIIFRCTYALTNLSLENSGEFYKCDHLKKVGSLDYNVARSPITPLTEEEFGYARADLEVMTDFLEVFREAYGSIEKIPLTQTGEVRREINKVLTFFDHKKVWDNIPPVHIYMALMCSFMGGIAHANYINAKKIIEDVASYDYASSYPFRLATGDHFPIGSWFTLDVDEIEDIKKEYCILYHVRYKGVKSRFFNHYLPYSKCVDKKGVRLDNGRIIKADEIELYLTDIDHEIATKAYDIEEIEVIDAWASRAGYLPKNFIEFILTMYERKTKLKGIVGQESFYTKAKQCVNALYGVACYNPMKQNYKFNLDDVNPWSHGELTEEFLNEKLAGMKKSYSIITHYAVGCWCTAMARAGLFAKLVTGYFGEVDDSIDRDAVYYDTDSLKFKNPEKHKALIDHINAESMEAIKRVCDRYDIPEERFSPLDPKGKAHPLGALEYEETYATFEALGAKKYAYTDQTGELHITIAGVPKSASVCMKNGLKDFKNGFSFPYQWKDDKGKTCGKLNMLYDDEQEPFTFKDVNGVPYTCNDIQYSVIAQPTVYTLGITEEYESLIAYVENGWYY